MPAISSGMYGFPKDLCAKLLLEAAKEYAEEAKETSLEEIRLCHIDLATVRQFEKEFDKLFKS